MDITILYFASLREVLGIASEQLALPAGVGTVGELRAWLCGRGGPWHEALAEGRTVRAAVDRTMARAETPVCAGAEVAFFPPVTGG